MVVLAMAELSERKGVLLRITYLVGGTLICANA